MTTALSGMKAIQEFCRSITLASSEASILQMVRDYNFPATKIGGIWESDKDSITSWRKRVVEGEIETKGNRKKNKGAARGFTLVELMIVIAIIAILATIGVGQWNIYTQNVSLKTEAYTLKMRLQETKTSATSKGINHDVSFDVAGNSYTITSSLATATHTPADTRVRITAADFSGGASFRFLARGLTDHQTEPQNSAGTVTMTNARGSISTITLTNPVGKIYIKNDLLFMR